MHEKFYSNISNRPHILIRSILMSLSTREVGEDKADQVIAFTQLCRVAVLDSETALLAADACRKHKLATADAIIYASARVYGADVITCDAHFKDLPGVAVIEKIGP